MKSILVLASTCLLAFFTNSVLTLTNDPNTIERTVSSESEPSAGGGGAGDNGNDDNGGGGNGDDDDDDDGTLAMHERFEPPPKHIRKAEIISGPPGIRCVFWAPQTEGDGESFISPTLRLPRTPEGAEAEEQSGTTLNKFDLSPEVPAFPAHLVTHFQVRRPDRKVVVLLEVRYDDTGEDQAVILHVDLDHLKSNGKGLGSVKLDGKEGQYSLYGYPSAPTVLRARVLAGPNITRTKCILGKSESLAAKSFTVEGEAPADQIDSAEMLLCTEEPDQEDEEY